MNPSKLLFSAVMMWLLALVFIFLKNKEQGESPWVAAFTAGAWVLFAIWFAQK